MTRYSIVGQTGGHSSRERIGRLLGDIGQRDRHDVIGLHVDEHAIGAVHLQREADSWRLHEFETRRRGPEQELADVVEQWGKDWRQPLKAGFVTGAIAENHRIGLPPQSRTSDTGNVESPEQALQESIVDWGLDPSKTLALLLSRRVEEEDPRKLALAIPHLDIEELHRDFGFQNPILHGSRRLL